MDTPLILIFIGTVIGAVVLTIILTRSLVMKDRVLRTDMDQLKERYDQLFGEHAALRSLQEEQKAQLHIALEKAEQLTAALRNTSNDLHTERQRSQDLQLRCDGLMEEAKEYRNKYEQSGKEAIEKGNEISRMKAEFASQQQRFTEQELAWKQMQDSMKTTFEALAGNTLEAKTTAFKQTQESEFKHLMEPLKQELTLLKEQLDMSHRQASQERNSLFGQVKEIIGQTKVLSDQAENLTKALKGQAKQQGDWGEWILESILEYSGLIKDREYFVQANEKNEEGRNIRPDVIVKYPDQRYVIIDSKVSLVGYDRIVASEDPDEQRLLTGKLVRHLKDHIDDLSSKRYQQKHDALDFVVMFVPLEGAYIAAMQHDPELWKYAYDKRLFLLSPGNLVAFLRLVHSMWQKDAVNKNAEKIGKRAALMYDKLVGFIEVFEKVGKNIDQAGASYAEAFGRLKTGKGNLISQAHQMNELQKRQQNDGKRLPERLVDDALMEDGTSDPDDDQIS